MARFTYRLGFPIRMETRSIHEKYEILSVLGSGGYGKVFKARNRATGDFFAIKEIRMMSSEEGFPQSAIREAKALQMLSHPNIIHIDSIITIPKCYFVMEFCPTSLDRVIHGGKDLSIGEKICFFQQIMQAVSFCHQNNVIHRDIKPSNILISKENTLKLIDFGLSRIIKSESSNDLSNRVVTQWYRAPELLLGSHNYSFEIDIWSCGCLLYEILTKEVLFYTEEESDVAQINSITKICGSIPNNVMFDSKSSINSLETYLVSKGISSIPYAIDLISKMLNIDPAQRPQATQVLSHPFFVK